MSDSNLFSYFQKLDNSTIVAFVKHQKEMSERMKNIYQKIKDITSAETRRMSEEEVLNLNNTLLTTVSHIFILDNFSGSSYDHLLSKKSIDFRIFGVPILEKMIENNDSVTITNYWKIFNNSFQGLVICTSNLNSGEKGKIENLVKAMDGRFTNTLSPEVTHLITNSTKTVKYSDAITLDIPIYHLEWVNHIWNKSLKQDNTLLKANAEQFDVFKLPPLFDLKITATGLSREKRKEISELIEENGGKFEEVFKPNDIDILIMEVADIENSKFKTACKFKIPVLSVDWINESIKAGYALSYNDFAFKRLKSENSSSSLSISETAGNVSTEEPKKDEEKEKNVEVPKPANILTDKTNNEEFLSTYTVKQAKKLGHIFDGYVFYFYNFPTESYFKVGKLISACGGIRITELDQSISHVLCYDKENLEDFHKKTIEKDFHGSVVDYKWLVECFKEEKLLSESDYLITLNSSLSRKIVPPSPLSRKAIQSLNVSIIKSNEESKKENSKTPGKSARNVFGSSSNMLEFSSRKDDEFIQTSIEANHKKIKQPPNVNRKRSHEEVVKDLCFVDESSKRRKTNDGESSVV